MRSKDKYPVPMKPIDAQEWLPSWRESYHHDKLEVWKQPAEIDESNIGYICSYSNRRHRTIELLLAHCPAPARVLDLAAAQGNFTIALAGLGYQVTWNDLRSELIDYVRMKLPAGAEVEFLAGNIFELSERTVDIYDAVLALEVIEHVAHPDEFIRQLAGLVRPGGVIVLSTPNGGYFKNDLPRFSDCPDPSVFESMQFKPNSDGHIFLLYEDEIRCFAERAGLKVNRLDLITNSLTAGHIKLRHALNLLPDGAVSLLEYLTQSLPHTVRNRLSSHIVTVLTKPSLTASSI